MSKLERPDVELWWKKRGGVTCLSTDDWVKIHAYITALEQEQDRLRDVVDAAKTWRDARRKPRAGFSTGADQESWDALHEAEAKFWTALATLGEE